MRAEREDKQRTWEQEDQKGGRQGERSEGVGGAVKGNSGVS